jgi:hypothetical protein
LTKERLAEIRAVAEKATHSQFAANPAKWPDVDALYETADPSTVLAMVDEIERLRTEIEQHRVIDDALSRAALDGSEARVEADLLRADLAEAVRLLADLSGASGSVSSYSAATKIVDDARALVERIKSR